LYCTIAAGRRFEHSQKALLTSLPEVTRLKNKANKNKKKGKIYAKVKGKA